MGNSFVKTPNIDKLAGEGALFKMAFAQNPICAPSRASFLTGRYPRTTRLVRNAQTIPADEKLISRLLADEGYVCGHAGKMHLSASSPKATHWCEKRIDDGYVYFDWSMHPPATPICPYTAWLKEHNIEFERRPVKDAEIKEDAINKDHQNEHDMQDGNSYISYGMDKETSNTAWIVQRAINFIECNEELEEPWFFTCDIEDPHSPYDPPEEFLKPYLDKLDEIPLPRYTEGELDNKPAFQRIDRDGVYGHGNGNFAASKMSDKDHRLIRAAYWAMVDHIDYQVGRLIESLEKSGQRENTIIVFLSDHGDMLGDHGMYMQGAYFYDEMVHVPLIVNFPEKVKKGIESDALIELTDLAPTLLELAGIEKYAGMQGKSFSNILTGKNSANSHRDSVYYEYYHSIPGEGCYIDCGGAYITGIRTDEFAITCPHTLDCGELYDLTKDPGMVKNLWDDPEYIEDKVKMLKKLCDRMADTIDPLPLKHQTANY
jgi:arylsulfatase A-like enzyme